MHEIPNDSKPEEFKSTARSWLYENWAVFSYSPRKLLGQQPLREIREYFGEKVAFYFSFLGFYTIWLLFPAICGLAVFIYGLTYSSPIKYETVFDNMLTAPMGCFMAIWASCFMEFWKRTNSTLANVWQVSKLTTSETRRPEWFATTVIRSPVTGKLEPHFPHWKKVARMTLSAIIIMLAV